MKIRVQLRALKKLVEFDINLSDETTTEDAEQLAFDLYVAGEDVENVLLLTNRDKHLYYAATNQRTGF